MEIPAGERAVVERLLTLARWHLGTEVAWASVLTQGRQLIVATSGDAAAMNVGAGSDLDATESYCVRVVAGRIPPVIPDSRRDLVTRELSSTRDLNIGSYAGVPWRSADGEVAGMVCCVSRHADPGLADRSPEYLHVIAGLLSDLLGGPAVRDHHAASELRDQVGGLFGPGALRTVFQPAYRLTDGVAAAAEALTRFDPAQFATPDRAFAAAARFQRGVDLELLAAARALAELPDLAPDVMLCVNLSAEALLDPRAPELLLAHEGRGLGVELTEHLPVADYGAVTAVTERLKQAGVRIVIDDAGAGYASLQHVLKLRPDVIKLDIALVRDIERDPVKQALARSLVSFAGDVGAALVAEGIETPEQLDTLQRIGVGYGQGFLLARPDTLANLTVSGQLPAVRRVAAA